MNPTQREQLFAEVNAINVVEANMRSEELKAFQQETSNHSDTEYCRPTTVNEVRRETQQHKETIKYEYLCVGENPNVINIPLYLNRPQTFAKSSYAVKWDNVVLRHANSIAKEIQLGKFKGCVFKNMNNYTRNIAVKFYKLQEIAVNNLLYAEGRVLDTENAIKKSLNIKAPKLLQAIKFLDEMDTLKFNQLLFKKYPSVVETIRKCKHYVANTKNSMTIKKVKTLKRNSFIIRCKAFRLYKKIKALFNVPEYKSFYSEFTKLAEDFGSRVSHLTMDEVFTLMEEPII